jgi:Glycosyl hydrolase catalytic core
VALGDLSTQITTNNVFTGLIDDNQRTVENFNALNLPLVRVHVGNDGAYPAMPEIQYNVWSFVNLDVLVNDETRMGQRPLMNLKFAPDWMWTCDSYGEPGHVRDLTFQTYAQYMARLVSYYNLGYMMTETGVMILNPAGTSNHIAWWEPWNEPDLSNETPCVPESGQALTPDEFLTMWNAVVPAMLAVDPTLKFVGPATAGGQFGSDNTGNGSTGNEYIDTLMEGATRQPDAISFHGYGYWDNTAPDRWIFNGDNTGAGGIPDMVDAASAVSENYPSKPIWITEINVNADWGPDPRHRPWNEFAAAWWAATYARLAPVNVAMLDQYNVVEFPQFGLLDYDTGNPYLPYWIVKHLNLAFPAGSTRLQATTPNQQEIEVTAARRPDGAISVLVADRKWDPAHPRGGHGLPLDVDVLLNGITPTAITLRQIDVTTPPVTGPTPVALPPSSPVHLHFPGYGMALLTITTG